MGPQIELLKYLLQDIRKVTLKGISGLTEQQLFTEPAAGEFPIGAYIMHLGECDLGWLGTLSGQEQPEDLKKRVYYGAWFDVPPEDFNPPREAIETGEYVNAITEARKRLLDYMDTINDEDLQIKVKLKKSNGIEVGVTKKWIIYHLIEHEAHTRGQMFMLIRMAGFKTKGENN
jgi:uncharacterized damage-inducible protein DinB